MWEDEIVNEVRRVRQEYAARFNNDLDAMVRDLKKLEQRHKDRLVSREATEIVPLKGQPKQKPIKKAA